MTSQCDNLDTFFDGELAAGAAQEFRRHLSTCTTCQTALHSRMQEAMALSHRTASCDRAWSDAPKAIDELAARRRTRRWVMIVSGLAAVVPLALWIHSRIGRDTERSGAPVEIAELGPERNVEVRFSYPTLDRHRPLRVVRAAGAPPAEHIRTATLAELESQHLVNAAVAARALSGELTSAANLAGALPDDARSLSDRSALELLAIDFAAEPVAAERQQQSAELALSLAAAALRRDPRCVQALWNKAIALKRLELPLVAAQAFDQVVARAEPGWSAEASDNANQLRRTYKTDADELDRLTREADRMGSGGAVMTLQDARRTPTRARDALYRAIAMAATPERLDALLPLAQALDDVFHIDTEVALVKRIRASNLLLRAPIAQALEEFFVKRGRAAALNDVRARALKAGLSDIALASFLVQNNDSLDEGDLKLLGTLVAPQDAWWKAFEVYSRMYYLQFLARDYSRAEEAARSSDALCKATPNLWCEWIAAFAGAANAEMGRLDVALERVAVARRMARWAETRDNEKAALDVLAQVASMRPQQAVDAADVSDAYFTEVALRTDTCQARLHRLDFVANAALERHRYRQAADYRAQADELEAGECRAEHLRLNGEIVRLRLSTMGLGDRATLGAKLARLVAENRGKANGLQLYVQAAATIVTDRGSAESALEAVIAEAESAPQTRFASAGRASAYATLIELAAGKQDAARVLDLVARKLRVSAADRCVVGVSQWNRVAIAVRGADGQGVVETREVPEGLAMFPAPELISTALRGRLAGCRRVEMLTSGPYFGTANLLPDELAWSYKSAGAAAAPPAPIRHELVVSEVTPPEDRHLRPLRAFQGSASATVLRRADATPKATLEHMKSADLIVVVAHGLTDAREPSAASLILSPEAGGDYLLTAAKVSTAQLDAAPVVVLAGCEAGRVQISSEPWSLATSFLRAGARAVIAPTEQIPDAAASEAFDSLVERIRRGVDPVDALQAERTERGRGATWLSSIVVFD